MSYIEFGHLTRACSRRSRLSRSVPAHGPRQPSSLLKLVVRLKDRRIAGEQTGQIGAIL